MAISEAEFENERELDTWVQENINQFLPKAKYLSPIQIITTAGKRGLPDGFAYDFQNGEWYLIEAELLSHGVWPHIAEQITRFVVATQNPDTRRLIRDHIFEAIMENDEVDQSVQQLQTTRERLLQQIELFVGANDPQVLIFIDETNQDLYDMANALSAQIQIFRVKKFTVNGNIEYLSPDHHTPVLVTEQPVDSSIGISEYQIIEVLGGGELFSDSGRFKCYSLSNGNRIHIKRSKYHARDKMYWYGVTPVSLENMDEFGVTHVVFIMGTEGFVSVPIDLLREFLKSTRTSSHEDGSIRHYHVHISPGPDAELFYSQELPKFDLSDYYEPL